MSEASKKQYTHNEKKFYGEIFTGYGDEVGFEFETEKECDEAMQNEENLSDGLQDFTTCPNCEETTEPKKRFIIKFENDDVCNMNEYMIFCDQKCFDEFFSTVDDPDSDDDVQDKVNAVKQGKIKILKPTISLEPLAQDPQLKPKTNSANHKK